MCVYIDCVIYIYIYQYLCILYTCVFRTGDPSPSKNPIWPTSESGTGEAFRSRLLQWGRNMTGQQAGTPVQPCGHPPCLVSISPFTRQPFLRCSSRFCIYIDIYLFPCIPSLQSWKQRKTHPGVGWPVSIGIALGRVRLSFEEGNKYNQTNFWSSPLGTNRLETKWSTDHSLILLVSCLWRATNHGPLGHMHEKW